MIVLLFGQPASGKTTLAQKISKVLSVSNNVFHIDGDEWRSVTKNNDYSKQGRIENLRGAFNTALYIENSGFDVVLSFVAPYESLRDYLRLNAKEFRFIYLTYDEDRGRNEFFVKDFEVSSSFVHEINTSVLNEQQCLEAAIDFIVNK